MGASALNQSEMLVKFLRRLTDAPTFDAATRLREYFDLLGGMFDPSEMLWRLLHKESYYSLVDTVTVQAVDWNDGKLVQHGTQLGLEIMGVPDGKQILPFYSILVARARRTTETLNSTRSDWEMKYPRLLQWTCDAPTTTLHCEVKLCCIWPSITLSAKPS
jgi:hypothetical protein